MKKFINRTQDTGLADEDYSFEQVIEMMNNFKEKYPDATDYSFGFNRDSDFIEIVMVCHTYETDEEYNFRITQEKNGEKQSIETTKEIIANLQKQVDEYENRKSE